MNIEKLAEALRPFAELLEYEYPEGKVFELLIHADDVSIARAALAEYDAAVAAGWVE